MPAADLTPTSGAANTGSGGGGGNYNSLGAEVPGSGADGIVIVRYPL